MEVDLVNYENSSGGYPDTHPTGTMEHWNSDELTATEGVETSFPKADHIMKHDLPYHCAFDKKATMVISPRHTNIYASPTDTDTYISPQNASPESLSSHPDLGKREEFVSSDIPVDDEFTSPINDDTWPVASHREARPSEFTSTDNNMRPTDRIPGIDDYNRTPEIRSFYENTNTYTHEASTSNQNFVDVNISLHINPGFRKTSTYNRSPVDKYYRSHRSKSTNLDPFIRRTFPSHVIEPSAVQGLSSDHIFLRTHFRIGEALAFHNTPVIRNEKSLPRTTLVELYAFVTESYRSGPIQKFTFSDIFFPAYPPQLVGEWSGWQHSSYLSQVGRYFLTNCETSRIHVHGGNFNSIQGIPSHRAESPKMCRVVGILLQENSSHFRIKPPRQHFSNHQLGDKKLRILRIQKADWSDIQMMKKALNI
ncbi:uncharacterized protein ARB_02939 [Trichophyton benhamiae CBS 112371]|uniref:Uncharacterized protein n=1 Tax=Arthroderma benhamiae (strain ATCC MYA-4681 / CBS 112371) TaxID=663331 RepID=D4B3A4_ARTBC|nr:uncharacterized protein ARB_02939 [Trichophyton benhamiae CBS 112371]EFE30150.1 hypothetical protein ARB_02939 [Trichophyton benhamiae CBS 112371]